MSLTGSQGQFIPVALSTSLRIEQSFPSLSCMKEVYFEFVKLLIKMQVQNYLRIRDTKRRGAAPGDKFAGP